MVELGASLLLIAAVFQLFDGLQAVATGVLRGLGETRTAMLVNLAAHWLLGLPMGYVLCCGIEYYLYEPEMWRRSAFGAMLML